MLEKQFQFSRMLGQLLTWMSEQDMTWVMGDCYRSTDKLQCPHCGHEHSYQEMLVYNKRSKTMKSKHADKCAVDITIFIDGVPQWKGEAYRAMGEHWERISGGKWGGRFGVPVDLQSTNVGWDPYHVEL